MICSRCHGTLLGCPSWQALVRRFVLACLARCVTAPRAVWWLPVALEPSSPTTFYPCGLEGPAPDALCVFRRELEVLSEAPPSIRRRAAQARIFRGSPPPVPKPRRDAASPKRFPLCAHTWPAHGGHQLGRKAAGFCGSFEKTICCLVRTSRCM